MNLRQLVRWWRVAPHRELPFTMAVLILAVAMPTAGLLFFMNRAMNGEGKHMLAELLAARQDSLDRALVKVRQDLEQRLVAGAAGIQLESGIKDAAQRFQKIMQQPNVAGCLILDANGDVSYPILAQPDTMKERSPRESKADLIVQEMSDEQTRTAQPNTVDSLLKTVDQLSRGRLTTTRAASGRVLRVNAMLAALLELPATHPRRPELLVDLKRAVEDHNNGMPTGQRVFLARTLLRMGEMVDWPELEATSFSLTLAQSYAVPGTAGIWNAVSTAPELLAVRAKQGGVVLFFEKQALLEKLSDVANAALAADGLSARFGSGASHEPTLASRPVGALLPGLEMEVMGPDAEAAVALRIRHLKLVYLITAIVGCLLIATLAAWAIRRFAQRSRDNQLKHDFLSVVSHELKTPLTSIRMSVDSLAAGGLEDTERSQTYLDFIRRENERLSRLVLNFLTFSKLDSGRMNFDFHLVHPEDIGEAAVAAMGARLESPVQFTYAAEPDLPMLKADQDSLTTALVNLMDNALKYSATEPRLGLTIEREGDAVIFAVTDNGIGMSPETVARLGEKYFRDRNPSHESRSGFGLGLHIVRSMVEAHGGKLEISSTTDVGSRMTLRLPAQQEPIS